MRVGKDMWKMECKLVAVAVETVFFNFFIQKIKTELSHDLPLDIYAK